MIRLNDINKTVIDEKSINEYYSQDGMSLNTIRMIIGGTYENFMYSTKEARNDDISLLDQLLEVKDIKEQVEIKLKKEKPIFDINTCAPVKKSKPEIRVNIMQEEKYITWEDVRQSEKLIKTKLPNGNIKLLCYDDYTNTIVIVKNNQCREARIYDKDLFNALMLKKVE
jgi:hypothetical protein